MSTFDAVSASPLLSPAMLARRVQPQLVVHHSADVGDSSQPNEQHDSDTAQQQPLDEDEQLSVEPDSWLPSVPSSPPPLPVTLRLRASGVGASMGAVLSFLRSRPDINQLDLRANGLTDDSLVPLLTAMADELCHIRALDLSGVLGFAANRLGQRAAEALARLLASHECQLATLRMAAMGRTALSTCLLQHRCLAASSSLTSLDLSGNALTNAMVRSLCRQLSGPHAALRRLSLARNELTDACCDALAALVRQSTALSDLSLAANQLTGRAMHAIAAALEPDTCSLTALILDDNHSLGERLSGGDEPAERGGLPNSGTVGLDRLFRCLSVNSSLQRLSLCGCSIGAVDELASSLAVNSTLTTLLLDRNPLMGSAGCASLLQALAHNTTLLSLSLAHNRLDDHIAPPLARLIQANPYLQSLSLADNGLTDSFIHAVLPTVYLNSHCAVSRLDLTCNHLQGKHTERLQSVMQRNARVQRRRLLSHYQLTISRLHALPGQLKEAAADIERLQRDCEAERAKEASTAQRVQAERAAMEADTVRLRAQLDAMRDERRQQTLRQSADLAALSSKLAAERSSLKAQAASLRQEVVNEKKIQAQLSKQLSRATAVWDSLEEIRRSGDIVERSLQQQIAALHADASTADESCSGWATKLQHTATAVVNRYWIAFNSYTHSKRFADRVHAAQPGQRERAQMQQLHSPSTPLSLSTPHHQQPALAATYSSTSAVPTVLSSPAGLADWSALEASGVLSFVPSLPSVGSSFDVDMADFLSWFFSTSTPSATVALIPAAMAKRMPIIAFAQAKCQTEAGRHIALFVQPAVTAQQQQQPTSAAGTAAAGAPAWPVRRSHVSLLGLLRLTAAETAGPHSPLLSSMLPALFSGCTLVVHPAEPSTHSAADTSETAAAATPAPVAMQSQHPLIASLATPSTSALTTQPSSTSSVLQLSVDSGSSWSAVLQAVSGLLSIDCSSPGSSMQLSCLPGLRLCQPLAAYLSLAADTPRLTLEEAMSELGGLNAITAAAALRKQAVAVDGQAAAGQVSDTALPTLSDDLNQLLADIGADLLMLSARSRQPQTQTQPQPHATHNASNRRSNRRTESRQQTASGPAAAAAAHGGQRVSPASELSELNEAALVDSGGDERPSRVASTVSAAPTAIRSSSLAAAGGGHRAHSHSLHRVSVQQQRSRAVSVVPPSCTAGHENEQQQQQQPAISGSVERSHARRSSVQLVAASHGSQASKTVSRAAHCRTVTRQLSTITATLAAGAWRSEKEQHRSSSSSNSKMTLQHSSLQHEQQQQHSKQPSQSSQRRSSMSRAGKKGSRRSAVEQRDSRAELDSEQREERSTDEDEPQQQLAETGEEEEETAGHSDELQRRLAELAAANDRPLAVQVSLAAVDVSSVARQPPAAWWGGTRQLVALPSAISNSATRPPLPSADFSLGQSDALLPFAPSNQHQSNALFAHLALDSKQVDFAADQQYSQSVAGRQPLQLAGDAGSAMFTAAQAAAAQRMPVHWQTLSRLVAPAGMGESLVTMPMPMLSAMFWAAIRPWHALCGQTTVSKA